MGLRARNDYGMLPWHSTTGLRRWAVRERLVPTPHAHWPPRVGDAVMIKGTRYGGTVIGVAGSDDNPLFMLDVDVPGEPDPVVARRLAASAMRSPAIYWLSSLEPRHR